MEKQANAASLARLPKYLAYLKVRQKQRIKTISSTQIAEDLRLYPVQVRKDLALASGAGRPRVGYPVDTLIGDLENFLGYHNVSDAFLVGVGRMGRALLGYSQLSEYGLKILAAFDEDVRIIGAEIEETPVFALSKLPDLAMRMGVHIGILAVPEHSAQAVCDMMASAGIRAIWNFAVTPLAVPRGVIVRSENLAASLAALSQELLTRE